MDAIVVEDLRKSFGKLVAVDRISFRIKKGEFFGLLGVNGAGKTTTINMLTGLISKDGGRIRILGKDPEESPDEIKNRMNVATAYYSLSETLTVRQNLRVYAKIYNIRNPERKIDQLLDLFEIHHLENRGVIYLSSGESTRVGLAKGLINDPDVLFLDECTVGLDPDIAEKTRTAIKEYHKRTGATILFTSHYMDEVEELCGRVAFMQEGRIVTIATADDLKKTIKKQSVKITVKDRVGELVAFLKGKGITIQEEKDSTIIFEVSSDEEQLFKVLNRIFAGGWLLSDLHIKKPTLNDIFIKLARENT